MIEFYSSKSIEICSRTLYLVPYSTIFQPEFDFLRKNSSKNQFKNILFSLNSLKVPRIISSTTLFLVPDSILSSSEFQFPLKISVPNSTKSQLVPNFPPKPIKTKHTNTHLSTNSNSHRIQSKHLDFTSNFTVFQSKGLTHENFQPKPINVQMRITKFSSPTLQVLTQIFKQGPSPDIVTYTTFIKFLGDYGCATEAYELFTFMKKYHEPDIISFTILIQILCNSKMFDRALDLLNEMSYYNCKPDLLCYNTLIDKLGEAGQEEYLWKHFLKMQTEGIYPDVITYSSIVKSLCFSKKMDEAVRMLEFMEMNKTIEPNTYTYNTIIKAFLDRKQIKEALGVLGRMKIRGLEPDSISFNMFIKYYSDQGQGKEAYFLLKWMITKGIKANESSYRICLNGLMKQGEINEVIELIEDIWLSSVILNICAWNKLIFWLSKMGRFDDGYRVFLGVKNPDEITMNTVIQLLYKHGRSEKAWEVFKLMKGKKIEASVVTYNILIHGVISKEGMISKALKLVLEMSRKGLKPDLISYNTLINGLINVGRTEDASKLFECMRGGLTVNSVSLDRFVKEMLENLP